jgi:hypothetical protein
MCPTSDGRHYGCSLDGRLHQRHPGATTEPSNAATSREEHAMEPSESRFFWKLYERAEGKRDIAVEQWAIANAVGLKSRETLRVVGSLTQQGLIAVHDPLPRLAPTARGERYGRQHQRRGH